MKIIYACLIGFLLSCSSKTDNVDWSKVKRVEIGFYETYALNELRNNFINAFTYSTLSDSSHNSTMQLSALVHDYSPFELIVKASDKRKVDSILAIPEIRSKFPADLMFAYSKKPERMDNQTFFYLYLLKKPVERDDLISGKDILSAESSLNENTGSPIISLLFNVKGTKKFELLTSRNIGRTIAILVDHEVIFCPTVQDQISSGEVQIAGNFTKAESEDLTLALRAGK